MEYIRGIITLKSIAIFEGYLVDGKRHGETKTYNKNGDVIWTGAFYDDLKHGEWIHYDDNGKVIEVQNYEYGDLILPEHKGECNCLENYQPISKIRYIPRAKHSLKFETLEKQIRNNILLDSTVFNLLFTGNMQFDRLFKSKIYNFNLVGIKPIKFQLKEMQNIDFVLNPCMKTNQFSSNKTEIQIFEKSQGTEEHWTADIDVNYLALEFDSKLLKQWDLKTNEPVNSNNEENGARLTFGLNSLSSSSVEGLKMGGFSFVCFTESKIGNKNMTIKLTDFKLTKYNHLFKTKLSSYYQGNVHKEGIFSRNAQGHLLIDEEWKEITYSDIYINGNEIMATITLDRNNSSFEKVRNTLKQSYSRIDEFLEEDKVKLVFKYQIK